MKQNDILLYGGIAVAAYFLLKKKAPTSTVNPVQVAPIYNTPALPASNANNVNSIVKQLPGIVTSIVDIFKGSGNQTPADNPASYIPVYGSVVDDVATAPNTSSAYVDSPTMTMWKNRTYPGALVAGMRREENGD